MAQADVWAGICGYRVEIEVTSLDRKHVSVTLRTECEMCQAMNPDLTRLQVKGKDHTVLRPAADSAVYQSAARHIRHPACVVPAAILKAIEVEIGAALPDDVTIRLKK